MTYASSSRLITMAGPVPSEADYINAPAPIVFTIKGFTNPATADTAYFVFTSYAVLDSGTFMID